jgi:hypothetical protein
MHVPARVVLGIAVLTAGALAVASQALDDADPALT